jgi:hypothetical protein
MALVVEPKDGQKGRQAVADVFDAVGSRGPCKTASDGLTGLLDPVEASDVTLTITSPPTSGTTLHLTLPLDDLNTDCRPLGHNAVSGERYAVSRGRSDQRRRSAGWC